MSAVAALLAFQTAAAFDPGRAAFSVRIDGDLVVPYETFGLFVLPNQTLEIEIASDDAERSYTLGAGAGIVLETAPRSWRWKAPAQPGLAELEVGSGPDRMRLNALVMHPAAEVVGERLNGYRIGHYPAPYRDIAVYRHPTGFVELTDELADLQVSPHFRLSQFPCKQVGGSPKYLVLREQLLIKLELLLEHVNERGIAADTFTIMSGFRTPFYNQAIGNGENSRHVFGGAADIYIDVSPQDGIMDDLDGNGQRDEGDAQWLYARAEELFAKGPYTTLLGGLGVYSSTSAHGPFLHMDARGFRARWGLLP